MDLLARGALPGIALLIRVISGSTEPRGKRREWSFRRCKRDIDAVLCTPRWMAIATVDYGSSDYYLKGTAFRSDPDLTAFDDRSEEHTSELKSLMRISYAVFCLKKKNKLHNNTDKKVSYTSTLS